jgi:hypothetical protein
VISLVGAASSRDDAMIAIAFFAAGSRSHAKSCYFDEVSHERRRWPRAPSLIGKETLKNAYIESLTSNIKKEFYRFYKLKDRT